VSVELVSQKILGNFLCVVFTGNKFYFVLPENTIAKLEQHLSKNMIHNLKFDTSFLIYDALCESDCFSYKPYSECSAQLGVGQFSTKFQKGLKYTH